MTTKLPLAPGSRWDGNAIVDCDGYRVTVGESQGSQPGDVLFINTDWDEDCCWALDAKAALYHAGNLPELDDLEKLRAAARILVEVVEDMVQLRKRNAQCIYTVGTLANTDAYRNLKALLPAEPKEPTNG